MHFKNIIEGYLAAACYDTDRSACRDWTLYSTGQTLVLYGETVGVGGRVIHFYCTIGITRWKQNMQLIGTVSKTWNIVL